MPRSETRIFQVDAFTSEPFRGNPAAVCLLDAPRTDAWMQSVAAEMNLSETAFVTRGEDATSGPSWELRWFTPTTEVPLCGHATLASAHILWESGAIAPTDAARFETRSGVLAARRVPNDEAASAPRTEEAAAQDAVRIEIDLPAFPVTKMAAPAAAVRALGGARVLFCGRTAERGLGDIDYLLELESEAIVRALRPDFALLAREVPAGVIATARAEKSGEYDFVSRYFAAPYGIDEDPVTGAAHCALGPYWSGRLARSSLVGYQASTRGGFVATRVAGDRALLSGSAVTVLSGTFFG
ncbi:MAG: PhzF family phenazine biosynthesis protein [bacterium]